MERENNEKIKKIAHNIKRMLIEHQLNFDENYPNKNMENAMTGNFDNVEEINRRTSLNVYLNEEVARKTMEYRMLFMQK